MNSPESGSKKGRRLAMRTREGLVTKATAQQNPATS